jgi:hypothetical protein
MIVVALSAGGSAEDRRPTAALVPTQPVRLAGDVDSNSPAVWSLVDGRQALHVLTSVAGHPSIASGSRLTRLGSPQPVTFVTHPGHGVWMEAVVADDGGTWYGYYHNEIPADRCGRADRMLPRIGAARSLDRGQTWEDLGIVLAAPPDQEACDSSNEYFLGGVGDVSAMLDHEQTMLYFFFSQYSRTARAQGVAVARMAWADRDEPEGRADVWVDGLWLPSQSQVVDTGEGTWVDIRYPSGTPLVQPDCPWHDDDPVTDAFWGPSVHWNTALEQYVMLVNRAADDGFTSEGIYVSFAPALDDPALWSPPERILEGGSWYPQVMGIESGEGTDKQAGARARFFMSGASEYYIDFGYR